MYRQFQPSSRNVSLTQFLRDVDSGKVETISIHGDEVVGVNTQTGPFRTYTPRGYVGFVNRLIDRDVDVSVVPEGVWSSALCAVDVDVRPDSRCGCWLVFTVVVGPRLRSPYGADLFHGLRIL